MEKKERKRKQLLYVTVHDRIKAMIEEQGLGPGDRLPSEAELEAQMGVSRGTLRQALMLLRESGVIYNHQGKGNFLSPVTETSAGLEKARNDLLQFSIVPIEKTELAVDYVPSSKTVQEYMEYSETVLLARFQFLYYHNEKAIAYRILLLPYKKLEESGVALDSNEDLMALADELLRTQCVTGKMTIDYVESRASVVQYMNAPANTYLYCISELFRDKAQTAIVYSKFYCYPEFFKFTVNRE